jgi:hypothetical protein
MFARDDDEGAAPSPRKGVGDALGVLLGVFLVDEEPPLLLLLLRGGLAGLVFEFI